MLLKQTMSGLDFIVSRWLFLFKAVQLSVFRLLTLKMANLICIVFSRHCAPLKLLLF